tara:strand:+ start:161 stop:1648 length:1488 start_codon:yes stop_codon:yes gene_type:complete
MATIALRRGSESDKVKQLQAFLFPMNPEEWDGVYGPKTEGMVKQFQRSRGLTPDGIVGDLTAKVFNDVIPFSNPLGIGNMEPTLTSNQAYQLADAGSTGNEELIESSLENVANNTFTLEDTEDTEDTEEIVVEDLSPPTTVTDPVIEEDTSSSIPGVVNDSSELANEFDAYVINSTFNTNNTGDSNSFLAYAAQSDQDFMRNSEYYSSVNEKQLSASAMATEYMSAFGLPTTLIPKLMAVFQDGIPSSSVLPFIRSTSEYKAKFPAMSVRREQGLSPLNEAQYLNLQDGYTRIIDSAGIDRKFMTAEDTANLIGRDVSLNEFQSRVALAEEAANAADPQTISLLQDQYNYTTGDITSLYLDVDRTKNIVDARRVLNSANLATSADKILGGIGETANVTGKTARSLKYELGDLLRRANVQERELQAQLNPARALTSNLVGEQVVDEGTVARGIFNLDRDSSDTIRRRRENRLTGFQGNSGMAASGQGGLGFGTTNT